jgi:hypothetical protein
MVSTPGETPYGWTPFAPRDTRTWEHRVLDAMDEREREQHGADIPRVRPRLAQQPIELPSRPLDMTPPPLDLRTRPAEMPVGLAPRDDGRPPTRAELEAAQDAEALHAQDAAGYEARRAAKAAQRRQWLAEHGINPNRPPRNPNTPSRSKAARAAEYQRFKRTAKYHQLHPDTTAPIVDWEREKMLTRHEKAMRLLGRAVGRRGS